MSNFQVDINLNPKPGTRLLALAETKSEKESGKGAWECFHKRACQVEAQCDFALLDVGTLAQMISRTVQGFPRDARMNGHSV